MLLAVDIGNSSVKFGIFDDEKLISQFKIPTVRTQTAEEIFRRINENTDEKFSALIISSVVPELKNSFIEAGEKLLGCETIFVDNGFDFRLKIKYNPPENLGVDRIVAAFAAVEKYGKPCIVCDFGTATTIDAVNSKGEYLGGIIAPGMLTLAESLKLRTSKLPLVKLEKPSSVIGNSTVGSIQSGIFYGYIGLTEGILRRMFSELGEDSAKIIATGGDAELIAENCSLINIVDEQLMLEGLRLTYEKFRQ